MSTRNLTDTITADNYFRIKTVYHRFKPKAIIGQLNIFSLLALAGVAGPLVLILADLVAAFSEPGYNPIRDSISILAVTSMGWIQTIGFLVIGLLVEIFIAGLLFNMHGRKGFGLSLGLLVCFGFGLLLIGAFPTDPPGATVTVHGTIHTIAALGSFWVFSVSVLLLIPTMKSDPYWSDICPYTFATVALSFFLAIGEFFVPKGAGWFGLYERIIVVNAVIWIEVMAYRLLQLSLGRYPKLREP